MKCIDESCETLHTGDNDNHKFFTNYWIRERGHRTLCLQNCQMLLPKRSYVWRAHFAHEMLIHHLYHLVLKVSLRGLAKTNFHDCYSSRFFLALVASLQMLRGIDSSVSASCKSPVLKLDLTKQAGQQLLWEVLRRANICGVHLAPPCGTASRAREIPSSQHPSPLPLRSESHPDGIPSLKGLDLKRVRSANCLYRLKGQVLKFCMDRNIPCSVDNPARSHFWSTKAFHDPSRDVLCHLEETSFSHCMYGSIRRKYTKLLHNCKQHLCALENIAITNIGTSLGASTMENGPLMQKLPIPLACAKLMLRASEITFSPLEKLSFHYPSKPQTCLSIMLNRSRLVQVNNLVAKSCHQWRLSLLQFSLL